MSRITLFGTPVDNLTMEQTLGIVENAVQTNKHIHHTVVNAGKIVMMHRNRHLRESVTKADIINADGAAIVMASYILGREHLVERVTGIDLMQKIVEEAPQKKYKIYFFGATEDVITKLVNKYSHMYGRDIVAGYRNGYFKKEEEADIAREIGESGANILFVAMTSPLKENFLYDNREALKKLNFIMGVGGSFDVVAGKVKRAPLRMQKSGLEWLYRVYQEPNRMFKRYLVGNLRFMFLTFQYLLRLRRS